MRRQYGISFVEVLLLMALIVVMVGLLLPAMGSRHRGHGRQMQNSTQVRGIHSGLVLYAQGNNMYYPGVLSDGVTIDPAVGLTVEGRIQKLIDDNYFTPEYARSPNEQQKGITSYSMLQVNVTPAGEAVKEKFGRNVEWRDTTNTEAVVLSDRAVNNGGSFAHIKSIHTKASINTSDWRGSVGWNDNHATFESSFNVQTKYGEEQFPSDHLFINQTGDAHTGSDAFMVWSGTSSL